jgi:hypothetical protein
MGLGDNVVQEVLETDVVLADGGHVGDGVLASLEADSSEVVVVGLDDVPVLVVQVLDVVGS